MSDLNCRAPKEERGEIEIQELCLYVAFEEVDSPRDNKRVTIFLCTFNWTASRGRIVKVTVYW